MKKLGGDMKLYIDAAGLTASPTWVEVTQVEEVTSNDGRNAEDIMNRGSDWVQVLVGKRNAAVEVTLTWDVDDAQQQSLQTAFNNKSEIAVWANSGDAAPASGVTVEGLQFGAQVVQMNRQEPLEGAAKLQLTLRPFAGAAIAPSFASVTGI